MSLPRAALISLAPLLLACTQPQERDQQATAPDDRCWERHISTPAVIETVTDREILSKSTEKKPAKVRSITRQNIITERHENIFETPCEAALTKDVIMTLQRALEARGYYSGPINGRLTTSTGQAIKAYQTTRGLPSEILSLETARALGVIAVPREDG